MITSKDEAYLKGICETNHCLEHDNPLVVAWHKDEDAYVVRCGAGHYPEEVMSLKTKTERYKAGAIQAADPLFNLLPKADLATGEVLSQAMTAALISYCVDYGLDAYRGHVEVMYGKPYITIDGYFYHAHKEKIPYQLRSRPLDEQERKTYMIGEEDYAWTCEVIKPLTNESFTGLGIVTISEMRAMSTKKPNQLRSPVVAAHPWLLAQKRAEWQGMRRAFPIGNTENKEED